MLVSYDTEDMTVKVQMDAEVRDIEALPGVNILSQYAMLRVWVPNSSCYHWMMTLSSGHQVSKWVTM